MSKIAKPQPPVAGTTTPAAEVSTNAAAPANTAISAAGLPATGTHPPTTSQHPTTESKSLYGFWVYLMTDVVLFATLFATYAVLHANTSGGEGASELFDRPFVLIETLILLTSSYTAGLAVLAAKLGNKRAVLGWLVVTGLLGLSFLSMELYEFTKLAAEGNSWTRSAFLSTFFTLVGTHGLHILTGLIWLSVLMVNLARRGLTPGNSRKLSLFSMFWHFLDVIWIFIFTFVYLMGAAR